MSDYDHIIVGRGLAGIVLSETLIQQGRTVLILDREKANSASKVAGGSMNPIAMKRIIMSWRAAEMMNSAIPFYQALETTYGASFIKQIPAQRIHASEEEARLWQQRELEEPVGKHISAGHVHDHVKAPYGSGSIPECHLLDFQTLLNTHKAVRSAFIQVVDSDDAWKEHLGSSVTHCGGPFADIAGLVPVQGELLTLRIPGLGLEHSLHRGGFLIPLGEDLYRLGSTFEWKDIWSGPSAEAKDKLLEKLRHMVELPVELLDHWAGTRPTTKDRRPILGALAAHAGHYVLNGLGSKGAMIAPWCAAHLCEHILKGKALDPEVDIKRFTKH